MKKLPPNPPNEHLQLTDFNNFPLTLCMLQSEKDNLPLASLSTVNLILPCHLGSLKKAVHEKNV